MVNNHFMSGFQEQSHLKFDGFSGELGAKVGEEISSARFEKLSIDCKVLRARLENPFICCQHYVFRFDAPCWDRFISNSGVNVDLPLVFIKEVKLLSASK